MDNVPFLVVSLKVQVLPCILAFIDGIGVDRYPPKKANGLILVELWDLMIWGIRMIFRRQGWSTDSFRLVLFPNACAEIVRSDITAADG